MSEIQQCGQCKAEIARDALFGLCQTCLFNLAVNRTEPDSKHFCEQGRRFGDYELGRQIGRGGMGVVYAAIQVSLHRPVALKMILDSQVDSPTARRRFTIEAEAVAKLDHPNIVPIYEVGEHEAQPFLSMKLVHGESLKDKLARGELRVAGKNGELPKSELRSREIAVARLMATVARAVQHAHQHGVLHRDLKPGNILVDGEGQPQLTDFGLAKILDRGSGASPGTALTVEGTAMGTPSYMSPEQASGHALAETSDIYSLGAVLYELLTGQPPFKAATPLETLRLVTDQQARRPSTLLRQIDRDLETVCLKCLEKKPEARYHSAAALADDLEGWIRQEPIRARPAGPGKRLLRWTKRNPLGAGLIVSLCAGLLVALALLRVMYNQGKLHELNRAQHQLNVAAKVMALWKKPDEPSLLIESDDLKALGDLIPRDPTLGPTKLTFAVRIGGSPEGQATRWARVLDLIEDEMEKSLHRPVVFALRLYKLSAGSEQPIAQAGDADFQRMGALSYVRVKEIEPGLQPVVREKSNREAVIYARNGLGITSLSNVVGHRVGFAQTNSTTSMLAKVYLAQAGVCAANLKFYTNFAYIDPMAVGHYDPTRREGEIDSEGWAHRNLTGQVLANTLDVGQIQSRFFWGYNRSGDALVPLKFYQVPPDLYVAKARLPADVVQAFQRALLSLTSKRAHKLLDDLITPRIEAYEKVSDSDYNGIRFDLTNWVRKFEAGPAVPPPAK